MLIACCKKTIKEVITGYQYSNIKIKKQAYTEDAYSSNQIKDAIRESCKCNSVKVEKEEI